MSKRHRVRVELDAATHARLVRRADGNMRTIAAEAAYILSKRLRYEAHRRVQSAEDALRGG